MPFGLAPPCAHAQISRPGRHVARGFASSWHRRQQLWPASHAAVGPAWVFCLYCTGGLRHIGKSPACRGPADSSHAARAQLPSRERPHTAPARTNGPGDWLGCLWHATPSSNAHTRVSHDARLPTPLVTMDKPSCHHRRTRARARARAAADSPWPTYKFQRACGHTADDLACLLVPASWRLAVSRSRPSLYRLTGQQAARCLHAPTTAAAANSSEVGSCTGPGGRRRCLGSGAHSPGAPRLPARAPDP